MHTSLPADVVAFEAAARDRFAALGGVGLALEAESEPTLRDTVGHALAEIGAWDVDVRGDADELLAAAALCRAAGAVALPFPLVSQLLAVDGVALALVDPERVWINHGDLTETWRVADLDGNAWSARPHAPRPAKLGPFVTRADLVDNVGAVPLDDVNRHLVLGSWRILGGLDASLALAAAHVQVRKQFGQTLAEFQSVRFSLADAVVKHRGLEELTKYTTWRLHSAVPAARHADAVALRLHAVEVAISVLRCCHQLFGAVGFCDEHSLSVIDRHMQSLLRLPYAADALAERLIPAVSAGELESLFTTA